ncbi:UNVERIFIED_CONTAM: uncharacterized protein DUF222 [Williamsia faeni]
MFENEVEAAFGDLGVSSPSLLSPQELVRSLRKVAHAKGYAAWAEYSTAAEIHRQLAKPAEMEDLRQLDGWAQCSARIAACLNLTPGSADGVLRRALALRDRLPLVNHALKSGRVAPHHISDIISRTELVEGMPWAAAIDAEIAEMLWRDGSWSIDRMRNMVDQIVFRHDPEGVRERRERAKDGRSFRRYPTQDGMADIVASMTAENALLLDKRVQELAVRVCNADPRTKPQRLSDALFCATMGVDFACECGNEECEYAFRDSSDDADGSTRFIVHVVMDQATAEGRASNPGFIDGHGVVSGDHAGDIARRRDARIRPLGGELVKNRASEDVAGNNASRANVGASAPKVPDRAPETTTAERLAEWKRLTKFGDSNAKDAAATQDLGLAPSEAVDDGSQVAVEPEPVDAETGPANAESAATPTTKNGPIVAGCEAPPAKPRQSPCPDTEMRPRRQCCTAGSERVYIRGTGTSPMPMTMRSNPYRLSTALGAFVRIRDAYCVFPGCNRPAWRSEIDHTEEYDHENPDAGGQTCPEDTKCLCRFHHLLKSFGEWIDVQELDEDGRSRVVFVSPEGERFEGPAWTGEDLFPALTAMTWTATRSRSAVGDTQVRTRTRLARKHARRQAERKRNRRRLEEPAVEPVQQTHEIPIEVDDKPPPF